MKKILALAVFAAAATTVQASTIASGDMFYSAYISCGSCVSVTLSWANEPFPISYAEVDNSYGFFLFALPVFGASTTGSINPNPDTVSGLSGNILDQITNGQVGVAVASIEPELNSFAILNLCDGPCSTEGVVNQGNVVDSRLFLASDTGVPEPAAWTLAAAGLTFLFIRARSQTRRSRV